MLFARRYNSDMPEARRQRRPGRPVTLKETTGVIGPQGEQRQP
jgi:hypothetical protein